MNKYLVIDCFNFTLIGAAIVSGSDNFEAALKSLLSNMLRKLKNTFPMHDIYGVWDTYGGTAFRKELFPGYKANRDNSKFDYKVIESMSSVYEEFGVVNIKVPQCEADDAIYLLCKILKESDSRNDVTIVTRDKDMIQVVQAGYADSIWDNVKKCYMAIPEYSMVDFKSLVGDKSDGIPGVAKIGEKTALQILKGFKLLSESQKEEFEKFKNIIDASRHPRFDWNYAYIKDNYFK